MAEVRCYVCKQPLEGLEILEVYGSEYCHSCYSNLIGAFEREPACHHKACECDYRGQFDVCFIDPETPCIRYIEEEGENEAWITSLLDL